MLGPSDIGHRVVVRRVVGERDHRPLLTDALGVLTSVTDSHLSIATDAGTLTVPLAAVVAAKRVPPRPVTRRPRGSRKRPDGPPPAGGEAGQ